MDRITRSEVSPDQEQVGRPATLVRLVFPGDSGQSVCVLSVSLR